MLCEKGKKKVALVIACMFAIGLLAACAESPVSPAVPETDRPGTSVAPVEGETTGKPEGSTYKVAYVSDMNLDAAQWLVQTVDDLTAWSEATDYIEEIKFVEATDSANFEPTIRSMCDANYDVIITSFNSHAAATVALSQEYPDIKFGIIDAGLEADEIAKYPNLTEIGIERGYNSFVAGVVAAYMSEANIVGFLGGADNNAVNWILAAWQQGLQYVNPDITDYVVYINSWSDPTLGKEHAESLIEKGCDVLAASAGGCEPGVCQSASENGVYYCAYDTHYYEYLDGLELGCAKSDIAKMIEIVIDSAIDGTFAGGQVVYYGYEYGTVSFEFAEGTDIPEELRALVDEVSEKILDGTIVIGKTPLHK